MALTAPSHDDPSVRPRNRISNLHPDSLLGLSRRRDGRKRAGTRSGLVIGSPHAEHNDTTSYLLSNLHCPSCVSSIKSVIFEACGDDVIWVSPNVVTSVVTVEHRDTPRSSVSAMAKALEDTGFEIIGITSTALPNGQESRRNTENTTPDLDIAAASSSESAEQAPLSTLSTEAGPSSAAPASAPGLSPTPTPADPEYVGAGDDILRRVEAADFEMRQRKDRPSSTRSRLQTPKRPSTAKERTHLEHCEACQRQAKCPATVTGTDFKSSMSVTSAMAKLAAYGKSSPATTGQPGRLGNAPAAKSEVVAPRVTELGTVSTDAANYTEDNKGPLWRATVAVGGMTCAVCVNTITQELNKRPWIEKATVNLVGNSATVDFYDESRAEKVIDAIEGLGYEASIDKVFSLRQEQHAASHEREIEVYIDGIFCDHCPERVTSTMGYLRETGLEVLSKPTADRPILRIRYVPDAPWFTVRDVLAAIAATDPRLKASIYHAPTLEERSRAMSRRHYRQLLWRVVLAAVMAVPSLVIGIVYMSLVSDQDHGKMMLMEPVVSGISRAQLILFALATPVYFLSASIFHTRAIKELHTLWRPGSRTPIGQRFYKFGSMNMLMSLGTSIAYFSSVGQMIAARVDNPDHTPDSEFYFDSVVFLTLFLLIGRLVEQYTKAKTGDAIEVLVKLRPTSASLVGADKDGKPTLATTLIDVDLLELGDVVRVAHGASPPADGVIIQGGSSFDESSLTGESRPIKKTVGDNVFAGTVNKKAPVLVRITGIGGSSMLDQIVAVVREGQTRRAPLEAIADLLTAYFVPAITLVAIVTWVVWLALGASHTLPQDWLSGSGGTKGPVQFSLQFAIAVFVVACPCGLALAAPTAIFVGGGMAAKHGILAKGGGEAFEKASRIDVVVFDKTGTLTVGGEPKVTDSAMFPDEEDRLDNGAANDDGIRGATLLAALCAVEDSSSHPIARAIVSFCSSQLRGDKEAGHIDLGDVHEIPGKGMQSAFHSRNDEMAVATELLVGNEVLMHDLGVALSPQVSSMLQTWKDQAKSVALVATRLAPLDGGDAGNTKDDDSFNNSEAMVAATFAWSISAVLAISDPIRHETVAVIRALKSQGLGVWMLSGDNASTAQAVASHIGIDPENVLAGVLPSGKADKVKYLQATQSPRGRGRSGRATVAMVGDGINDSPALTAADVGIAIGSGSDVAISSADFVLVKSDLRAVVTLLGLSRSVFQRIKTNFGWAVVYNLIAVPVAAGVLYPIRNGAGDHIRLDPVWAALAMALSSVSVVVSSLLLRTRIPVLGFRAGEVQVEKAERQLDETECPPGEERPAA